MAIGDDLAVVLPLDHRQRSGLILPDALQAVNEVADLHRHGRDDADVGRDRRRRHHAHGASSRIALAATALTHVTRPLDQLSCHLIILSVSPRRLLTPTAADVS